MIVNTFQKENKSGGPILLWGTFPHRGNETKEDVERMWSLLREQLQDRAFLLYAYEVEDWNKDFSPWPADPIMGRVKDRDTGRVKDRDTGRDTDRGMDRDMDRDTDRDTGGFSGGGPKTLSELEQRILPDIKKTCGERPIILMGYSLAGLFSLWAAYESKAFAGVICGSGSLWFPGWMEYAKTHPLQSRGPVYLSLGGKEEKTANAVMAGIGRATREELTLLEQDANATFSTLEMNSGGHFADSQKRLAKGAAWMLKHFYN